MLGNLKLWGNIALIMVIAQCIFLIFAFTVGTEILAYELFIINLIAAPLCLIGFMVETFRGVFREEE